jgi:non-heme chloroperoxidase
MRHARRSRSVNILVIGLACFGVLFLTAIVAAFTLIASSPPKMKNSRDIFGFSTLNPIATGVELPSLQRYTARDGEELAYRIYDSSSDRILIFLHGSSYHGAGYHELASAISMSGAAKVVLPNLRGHFQSGRRRGDVSYIGQLEDDLIDLIQTLRQEGLQGPITFGGHSSGGGLAIRFAGGAHEGIVPNYMLMSPVIPTSPTVREGNAGGWASLHVQRLYGLLILNALGVHGYNDLPIIEFNKPAKFWDGTETLSYSYRLNASYHPRLGYADDIRALEDKAFVLVGSDDEAVDPDALRSLFASSAPRSKVVIMPHINHFRIFTDTTALRAISEWLRSLPPR